MEKTRIISERLVVLLKQKQFVQAYEELFSNDAESIDPLHQEISPIIGLPKLIALEKAFLSKVNIHLIEISDVIHAGQYFAFTLLMNFSTGGKDSSIEELCVYQINDGKIVSQQFSVSN